eukprot:scaffold1771_cov343-Pavlova_lutheri.AAC.2
MHDHLDLPRAQHAFLSVGHQSSGPDEGDWHDGHLGFLCHGKGTLFEISHLSRVAPGPFGKEQDRCSALEHLSARLQAIELAPSIHPLQPDVSGQVHAPSHDGNEKVGRFGDELERSPQGKERVDVQVALVVGYVHDRLSFGRQVFPAYHLYPKEQGRGEVGPHVVHEVLCPALVLVEGHHEGVHDQHGHEEGDGEEGGGEVEEESPRGVEHALLGQFGNCRCPLGRSSHRRVWFCGSFPVRYRPRASV